MNVNKAQAMSIFPRSSVFLIPSSLVTADCFRLLGSQYKYLGVFLYTGTLKHVKSSVARSGGIVLRWSSGYGAGG